RNMRSREAIERVGATLEGILRKNRASAVAGEIGMPRDTAMHSILDTEWPSVKANLVARLA
ncbi:MAG: ydaF 3, partial [Ilumatobacteraceae bacterium]|nr:ydaF 3 [Ilumatobacteraceae bacterium]